MSRLADAGGVSKSLLFHYFLNKKELYLYLWEHACRLYREKVRKGDTQTTDLFEILCQRVLAGCVFMREAFRKSFSRESGFNSPVENIFQ